MTEQTEPVQTKGRPRRWRIGLFALLSVAMLGAAVLLLLIVARGELQVPKWATSRIEERLNAGIDTGTVRLGDIRLSFRGDGLVPTVQFADIAFLDDPADSLDRARAVLPMVETELDTNALRGWSFRPRALRLTAPEMRLSRAADGSVDVAFRGEGVAEQGPSRDLDDMILAVERLLEGDYLRQLQTVEADNLRLTFDDAVTGRTWNVTSGTMTLQHDPDTLSATLAVTLEGGRDTSSGLLMSLEHRKGAPDTRLRMQFSDVPAADIAAQSAALSWLAVLDAPISGAVAMQVADAGRFAALSGTLEVGAGALDVQPGMAPVEFERAKVYFNYDESADKLIFDQIAVESPVATIMADGHAYLTGRRGRSIGGLITQLRFETVRLDPPGVFAEPVEFSGGALDMRVALEPFRVDVGQLVVSDDTIEIQASGHALPTAEGWQTALDLRIPSLSHDRLMALWPVALKIKTRTWMSENVSGAVFRNAVGAFRLSGGKPPRLSLNFDFEDLTTRYVKALPLLKGGRGYGALTESRLDLHLTKGMVTPPHGGPISLAGTTMSIPDITIDGSPADIALRTAGSLRASLELLDHAPFGFLSKADIPTDIATGRAETAIELALPLRKNITFADVSWSGRGRLLNTQSDRLIRDKILHAPELAVRADKDGVSISGTGRLGELAVNGGWVQKFGPEHKGQSQVDGTIELSEKFMRAFGIALPPGAVSGSGIANIGIELRKGQPAAFRLVSDLNRVALRLDALGWSKPAATLGRLEVSGTLAQPATIDALQLEAAGLRATGKVSLTDAGALDLARFDRVQLGDWLDAAVELRGQGGGAAPLVSVQGGRLDMRRADFGTGGGAGGGPVTLRLDQLIVTDGIALTGVQGDLNTADRLNGRFGAMVNGAAPVAVTLVPVEHGTGIRLLSQDAGGVLRAAGIFSGARQGDLTLQLRPTGEPGTYEGIAQIKDIRVRDAPALAALLSAVSVIGLLEQLSGAGIVFSEAEARLHLSPRAVTVRRGNAIGPSMGISMEGFYDVAHKRLDMQGVVTPLYMLNGALEQTRLFGDLFGRTKGEGVIGFTYRLRGPSAEPAVSVNPLSVLAPGLFRQIFRRPPPSMPQQQ